jgi:hypothetical protein
MFYRKLLQMLIIISCCTSYLPIAASTTQSSSFDTERLNGWLQGFKLEKIKRFVPQDRKSQLLAAVSTLAAILAILSVYRGYVKIGRPEDHMEDLKKLRDLNSKVVGIYNGLFPDDQIQDGVEIAPEKIINLEAKLKEVAKNINNQLENIQNDDQEVQLHDGWLKTIYNTLFPNNPIQNNVKITENQIQLIQSRLKEVLDVYRGYDALNEQFGRLSAEYKKLELETENLKNKVNFNQPNNFGIENTVILGKNNFNRFQNNDEQLFIYCDLECLDQAKKVVIQNEKDIICCLSIKTPQGAYAGFQVRRISSNVNINNPEQYDQNDVEYIAVVIDPEIIAELANEHGGVSGLSKFLKNRAQSFAEKSTKSVVWVTYFVLQGKDPAIPNVLSDKNKCDLLVFIGDNVYAKDIIENVVNNDGSINQIVCAGVSSTTITSLNELLNQENNILQNTNIVHFYSPVLDTNDIWRNWNRKMGNGSNTIVDVMVAALNNILEKDGFVTKVNGNVQEVQYQENMIIEKSQPYLHLSSETVAKRMFELLPGLRKKYIQNKDFYTLTDYLLMLNFHPENFSGSALMTLRNESKVQYTSDQNLAGKILEDNLLVSGPLMNDINEATKQVYKLAGGRGYQKPSTEMIKRINDSTKNGVTKTLDYCVWAANYLHKNKHYVSNGVNNGYATAKENITNLYQKVQNYIYLNNDNKVNNDFDQDLRTLQQSMKNVFTKTQNLTLENSLDNKYPDLQDFNDSNEIIEFQ